ncbi:hypothetical protein V6N13_065676 [Hibiscus sabdariffa]
MQSPSPLDGDLKDSTTDEALVIDLGQARGRPPDGVLQILVSPALERLGSPPAVEDLRIVKKSRGEDGGVEALDYSDAIDFDADGQQGFDGVGLPASSHSKMNGVASMEAKAKATYASIDGFVQKLEYEGLQHICYTSGVYGHGQEVCPQNSPLDGTEGKEINTETTLESRTNKIDKPEGLFGPWMVVDNRRCRAKPSVQGNRGKPQGHDGAIGSRFAALDLDEDDKLDSVPVEA